MLLAAGLRLYRGLGECEPGGGEEGKKGEGVQRSQVQKHFILCVRKEPLKFHLNLFESALKVRVWSLSEVYLKFIKTWKVNTWFPN